MANLEIITTPFLHRDAAGIECVGTHACSFAVSRKENRFIFTCYLPPWMTRPFKKRSTLKDKKISR